MLLSPILIGILNLERAVRPSGNIDAAIPDVAVAMAINPLDRTLARRALYRNILPVPPGPSTKKTGSYWQRHAKLFHQTLLSTPY
jgi:hypothetical protein